MLKAYDETINEKPTGENRYADHTASEALSILWQAKTVQLPHYLTNVRKRFVLEVVSNIARVEIIQKLNDEKKRGR